MTRTERSSGDVSDPKNVIETTIRDFVWNERSHMWREPLIGYADANGKMMSELKNIVSKDHLMPADILSGAETVISYFIPFTKDIANSNISPGSPSAEWIDSYSKTNEMAAGLNDHLASKISEMGFRAAVPKGIGMNDELKSIWSQRHIARSAGLGSFGINNMLISEAGCCGRYFSVVTDIPIVPNEVKGEYCLYKLNGSCGVCIKRCSPMALSHDGFDRRMCLDHMNSIAVANADADICGKCVTGLPCSFRRP